MNSEKPTSLWETDSGKIPVARKRNISLRDADLLDQATHACDAWKNHPDIALIGMSQPDFEALIADTRINYEERVDIGGGRRAITAALETMEKQMNSSVAIVKAYLAVRYDSVAEAQNHYAKFGLVKKHGVYRLPNEKSQRINALKLMCKNIAAEGLDGEKTGIFYWTNMLDDYTNMVTQAGETDGKLSHRVGIKKMQMQTIRQTLQSLSNIIKANFPNTYRNELRLWGFQKEKL